MAQPSRRNAASPTAAASKSDEPLTVTEWEIPSRSFTVTWQVRVAVTLQDSMDFRLLFAKGDGSRLGLILCLP
jgi:hypothetical protein